MERKDWISLSVSLVLHVLLLGGFSLFGAFDRPPQPIGFVEVELGPLAEGQPVAEAEEEPETVNKPSVQPEAEPQTELKEQKLETRPLDLPEQPEEVDDPETVETPTEEETDAETPGPPADEEQTEEEAQIPAVSESGGGSPEGTSGQATGDEGEGTSEEKSAPFQIEGLNRNTLTSPLPAYPVKIPATIKVRITVGPQGGVVQSVPLMKGNPQLERAVMDVLKRWRFNPLPANAPQENQTGVITFRFRPQ